MAGFEETLQNIMLQTFSVHDVKGSNPEKFYHGFMLGLISGIYKDQYRIGSNKESGLGRYDILLIPNDTRKLGMILEIKNLKEDCPWIMTQNRVHLYCGKLQSDANASACCSTVCTATS